MANLTENILQAIDVVAENKISKIKADITAPYIISDNSKSGIGEYKVSTNAEGSSVSFTVYTQAGDTYQYQIGDAVYVLIPGGKYSERKFIVGLQNNLVKESQTPTDKENATQFIALREESFQPADGVASILENKTAQVQIGNTIDLSDSPIVLINYDKIRIAATFKLNIGELGSYVEPTSADYAIRIEITDNTTNQLYYYTLTTADIFGSPYRFGNSFYTFTKDLPITAGNFRADSISCYWIQNGEFKDSQGTAYTKYKVEIQKVLLSFGWQSADYKDALYIYEKDNRYKFDGSANYILGVKLNYRQKELAVLPDEIDDIKQPKIHWLKQVGNDQQLVSINNSIANYWIAELTNDMNSYSIKAIIGETLTTGSPQVPKAAFTSNVLTFDNTQKISYNYNISIENPNGLILKPGVIEQITLVAVLSQNNENFEIVEYETKPVNPVAYKLYRKKNSDEYFIWEDNGYRQVVFEWNDDKKTKSHILELIAKDVIQSKTYTCTLTIGGKGE